MKVVTCTSVLVLYMFWYILVFEYDTFIPSCPEAPCEVFSCFALQQVNPLGLEMASKLLQLM